MKRVENGGNCVVFANSIGYAPQTAWIQNKTLRDNILFGKQFDDEYYKKTLKACALLDDLALLPARDMTEIGEKVSIRFIYSFYF
jgi:ABC-type multidrug transport system fused ATPase/permease subunit